MSARLCVLIVGLFAFASEAAAQRLNQNCLGTLQATLDINKECPLCKGHPLSDDFKKCTREGTACRNRVEATNTEIRRKNSEIESCQRAKAHIDADREKANQPLPAPGAADVSRPGQKKKDDRDTSAMTDPDAPTQRPSSEAAGRLPQDGAWKTIEDNGPISDDVPASVWPTQPSSTKPSVPPNAQPPVRTHSLPNRGRGDALGPGPSTDLFDCGIRRALQYRSLLHAEAQHNAASMGGFLRTSVIRNVKPVKSDNGARFASRTWEVNLALCRFTGRSGEGPTKNLPRVD